MTEASTAILVDGLDALKQRKRLLDDAWLITIFVLFFASGIPWYLRILAIDFAPIAWSLFAFGSIYVAFSFIADRLNNRKSILTVLGMLHLTGILLLGYVWHLSGSLQNPMFLLAFVLPLIAGSAILVNWHSYITVAVTLGTVLIVVLMDAPELRWYAAQTASWATWLVEVVPEAPSGAQHPFPGLNTPPAYLAMVLGLFCGLLLTVAMLTDSLSSFLLRLYGRLENAKRALTVAEDLSSEVLRVSPVPTALVYADTFMIAQASESLKHQLLLKSDSPLNCSLFQIVRFMYPEVVESLIVGRGGKVPLTFYRVENELRIATVHAQPIQHGGHQFAYVSLQDITDLQYLQATLNAVDDAMLVLSPECRILYFNSSARGIWGELQLGMDASAFLGKANLPEGWWELGMRTRQERLLTVNGQRLKAHCIAVTILALEEKLTIIATRSLGGKP